MIKLTDESLMDFSDWLIDISFLSYIRSLLKLWSSFLIHLYHLSWFQWGIFTSMGWSRDFFWWQKYRSQQVGVCKSTRIARRYLMTKFIHFPMIFPWFSPFKRGKSRGRSLFWKKSHVLKRAARCTTFRCSGFWWFAHGSQFRDQVVSHDPKRVYRMYRGFLKWGIPKSPWVSILKIV